MNTLKDDDDGVSWKSKRLPFSFDQSKLRWDHEGFNLLSPIKLNDLLLLEGNRKHSKYKPTFSSFLKCLFGGREREKSIVHWKKIWVSKFNQSKNLYLTEYLATKSH